MEFLMFWKIPPSSLAVDSTEGFVNFDLAGSCRLGSDSRSGRTNSYSNEDLVDMQIVYGTADYNGHNTWWLYQKR
ncbi:hypothetical protein TNCV_1397761 [Trichonephila clavipes]|nr:hypothetical protein TNCV_1397761 [Trichonephila clavipes]